jgi:dephospho-CoA kinase
MEKEKKELRKLSSRLTIIGLTGLPCSGKSALLELLAGEGFFCVSADGLVKQLLTEPPTYNRILNKFGKGAASANGAPDPAVLSKLVFENDSNRKWLEGLLHPLVVRRACALIRKSRKNKAVVEAPLLFEAGLGDCFTLTACVTAPAAARRRRAAARGWPARELARREKAQFSQKQKAALADLTIENAGTRAQLRGAARLTAALAA